MSQVEITIKFDFLSLTEKLSTMAQKQIPFATSLALNNVAKIAQKELREELPRIFTLRTSWLAKGIQFKAARAKDWPESFVEIGSRDDFMALQETGGEKTAIGNKRTATPFGARPTPQSVTKPAVWPGKLLKRKNYFAGRIGEGQRRAGAEGIFKRAQNDEPPELMYILTKSVKIKPRWTLRETLDQKFNRHWDTEFGKALARALATAKD